MHSVRGCSALVIALAGIATVSGACARDEEPATNDQIASADTMPAPPQQQAVNYDVDPRNVAEAMQYDSVTRTVTYPIVAGLTSTNNAWNFNGYAEGRMTVVVPVGASVVMPFSNMDGNVPHSFGITADDPRNLPMVPGAIVFPGAETRRFEAGLRSTERDIVRFTASSAGRYLLICGVPGHAIGGMWIYFEVSRTAQRPAVRVQG